MRHLDDATSALYSAFFVEEEGTHERFAGCAEVLEAARAVQLALYRPRQPLFVHPRPAGKVRQESAAHRCVAPYGNSASRSSRPIRRRRAAAPSASSAPCKTGCPKSWRLAEITTMAAANRYLAEQLLPAYNARFAVAAAEPGPAFVPWTRAAPRRDSVPPGGARGRQRQHGAVSGPASADPARPHRLHFVKGTVRVHEYPDGTLAVFHGPRCLVRYQPDGPVIESEGAPPHRRGPIQRSGDRPIVAPRAPVRKDISASG